MRGKTHLAVMVSAAAFIASGLVFRAYNDEISSVRAVVAMGGRIANTSAGPVEYAESGTGLPILSIHGSGGGYDQGLANAAEFIGNGFRIIAPSRFGYLGTPAPETNSPSAQADALAALLTALKIDKAVVVGVSAGALSALELALRHPDRVAVLLLMVPAAYSPSSPVQVEASRASRFAFWLVNAGADFLWWAAEKMAPSALIRFMGVPPELVAAAPKSEQERVMKIVRSLQPLSRRAAGINIDSKPDLHRLPLERIKAPSLVISVRDDLFNTLPAAEHAAGTIPDAKLVIYNTGGHLLVGHGKEVRALVGQFLANAGAVAPAR